MVLRSLLAVAVLFPLATGLPLKLVPGVPAGVAEGLAILAACPRGPGHLQALRPGGRGSGLHEQPARHFGHPHAADHPHHPGLRAGESADCRTLLDLEQGAFRCCGQLSPAGSAHQKSPPKRARGWCPPPRRQAGRLDQEAPLVACSSFSITRSREKLAVFWRGGNSTKVLRNSPT